MIRVFTYRLDLLPGESVLRERKRYIGFTDLEDPPGIHVGDLCNSLLDEWVFIPKCMIIGLTSDHFQTILTKIQALNAQAVPTKKSTFDRRHKEIQALRKKASSSKSGA